MIRSDFYDVFIAIFTIGANAKSKKSKNSGASRHQNKILYHIIPHEVRYFPKFGQILVGYFVKNGSDLGQIFGNFGQILKLSTLVKSKA